MKTQGTIIALAWPDTKVVKEGKWYDYPMKWLGFLKDDYYNAGHAALLLVNHQTGHVEYFDFGRYHTPYQFGRVRDRITDPDVEMTLKANVRDGEIVNIEELLLERYANKACHGDGRLTAAICKDICYETAYQKAKKLQAREAIPYGPFVSNGSTCSRLVVQVVYPASNCGITKAMIRLPYTLSATPRSNNKVLNNHTHYYEVNENGVQLYPNKFYGLKQLFKPSKSNTGFVAETA